jgi:hypothetical protein
MKDRGMSKAFIFIASLTLGAAAGADPQSAAPKDDAPAPTSRAADAKVPEVAIESFVDDTVCRRQQPTGSRIAVKRCRSKTERETPLSESNARIRQQELEELRLNQQYLEQARARARAEALHQAWSQQR